MIHKLTCRFCGKECGQIDFPHLPEGTLITANHTHVDDMRCDDCQNEHGSYKRMHDEFVNVHGSHDDFLRVMQRAGHSSKNFKKEVDEHNKRKVASHAGTEDGQQG